MHDLTRCDWCGTDPLYVAYHDMEWGVPIHEDRLLFEFLILEGAQAGLSWLTVLKKRDHYRRRFHQFDPQQVAAMTDDDLESVLLDPGVIRNRLKVHSARRNARVFLDIQQAFGSFNRYWWQWVGDQPILNHFQTITDLPSRTELSDRISKDLKKRGMNFVGSTIIYAMMQATGLVNDHLVTCHRYPLSQQ